MPHLFRPDPAQPQAFYDEVLKEMGLPEGTEIEIEKHEDGVLLKPHAAPVPRPLSPQEKAQAFREWVSRLPVSAAPPLSDEAISRESIYTREDEQL
jgi:hypothetical protein